MNCDPSLASSSSLTSSDTSLADRPAERDSNTILRQGRPAYPQHQSSYGKRHASFDTPREVPFPAQHLNDVHARRLSFSRSSSGSTVGAASRPLSPSFPTQGDVPFSQPDHVPLSSTVGKNDERGVHLGGSSCLPSPMNTADDTPGLTNSMTYKCSSAGAGSPSFTRNAAELNHGQRNAGFWDSDHLRPHLLSSPSKGKGREYQLPSDHHQSLASPYSPCHLSNQEEHGGFHAPMPVRPSSASSLPLPSQMPFFALPSTPSNQQQANAALPRVVEQVQSNFDSYSDSMGHSGVDTGYSTSSSSRSHDPRTLRRQASSPPLTSLSALFESADRHGRRVTRASATGSVSTASTSISASSRNSSASSSLPPPTPPTVHTPPPPPYSSADEETDGRSVTKEGKRQSAPYEPFLSHAPPPADSYITVETTDTEYRLIVRLPGYRRDAIMLSTRRRRILHIAADSWEAGGGHFERRISFGYDADLTHVRAEFDGEHLRVLVPRKVIPVTWVGSRESG